MDFLQFPCPRCDKRLKVPSTAAGQRGPCPNCGEEIIGPQPALGIPARISLHAGPPLSRIPLPPSPEPKPEAANRVAEALEVFQPKEALPSAHSPQSGPAKPKPAEAPPAETAVVSEPRPIHPSEPERRIRRLWAAVFVLSCVLCTVLAFIGGYLTALKRTEVAAPIFAAPGVAPEPAVPPSDPPPPPAAQLEPENNTSEPPVDKGPPPADPPPTANSRATLEAFLSAPDWTARSAYVDETALPAMKTAAEEEGDEAIKALSIEPSLLDGKLHHYRVATERVPGGFPVTLRESPAGWQVDWSSFHEFSTKRFERFLAGELGETGRFRLFLKPAEDSQPAFAAYTLSSPVGDSQTLGYASRAGQVHSKLTALLGSGEIAGDERYRTLLENSGLPVMLQLERKTSSDGRRYVEIGGLSALGWSTTE